MLASDLIEILKKAGTPVAYSHFKEKVNLPYITCIAVGRNTFGADNIAYASSDRYQIELYTAQKDFDLEERLETILDENEIYYEKSGDIPMEDKRNLIYYQI